MYSVSLEMSGGIPVLFYLFLHVGATFQVISLFRDLNCIQIYSGLNQALGQLKVEARALESIFKN